MNFPTNYRNVCNPPDEPVSAITDVQPSPIEVVEQYLLVCQRLRDLNSTLYQTQQEISSLINQRNKYLDKIHEIVTKFDHDSNFPWGACEDEDEVKEPGHA